MASTIQFAFPKKTIDVSSIVTNDTDEFIIEETPRISNWDDLDSVVAYYRLTNPVQTIPTSSFSIRGFIELDGASGTRLPIASAFLGASEGAASNGWLFSMTVQPNLLTIDEGVSTFINIGSTVIEVRNKQQGVVQRPFRIGFGVKDVAAGAPGELQSIDLEVWGMAYNYLGGGGSSDDD